MRLGFNIYSRNWEDKLWWQRPTRNSTERRRIRCFFVFFFDMKIYVGSVKKSKKAMWLNETVCVWHGML